MHKKKAARLAGFIGALCASGALVGIGVAGTGAYFTDSHNGAINASTGHIRVTTNPTDGQLDFTNLLPGAYQTDQLTYKADVLGGAGATEDVWLVFPPGDGTANPAANPSEAFTGNPSDGLGGGLGRYGHFALTSSGGAHFTSYNLNNPGTGSHSGPTCSIDPNGWGGSNAQPTSPSDTTTAAFCAPANYILLSSGMANGQSGWVNLTFGFTPLLTDGKNQVGNVDDHNEDQTLHPVVNYQIVATQHGVRPNDPFNGS